MPELSVQKRFAVREYHRLYELLMDTFEKLKDVNINALNNKNRDAKVDKNKKTKVI